MPKRVKQAKSFSDIGEIDHDLAGISTAGQNGDIPLPTKAQISLLMSKLGKKGGKIGGKRRLETMSAEERSRAASNAAKARWEK